MAADISSCEEYKDRDPQIGQSPSGERGDSRGEATTSLVSLSAKEKKINNAGGSVLLQTFSALVTAKPKGNVQLRCMLDGGANKSFILREVVELLDLKERKGEVNCKDISANHLIVENEELGFDRVRKLWSLEAIGINPDDEVPLSDKKTFEIVRTKYGVCKQRYETRLLWKEDSRELKSNYE
ncbi:integrase catalytic domain-containing protein [Trichonephila clavata]|uniref:Integrase catalytic domain-containing protein n=1 Tax=Trichonephila clavata TaxID=2740835 RepID=A0A8X6LB95_TRICU|nr:integrase catalytic domain-containing protein [Trichonephila clavata]